MRPWLLVFVAALAAGTGLRLHHLGDSLRVDEVEAWAHSQKPMAQILADTSRLPHVSVLNRLSGAALGDGESALRLPYALYGILSLPLLFLLGRRLYGTETGALACLLLAFSAFHIQYSQEARYYAPLMFYALAALYCMSAALGAAAAGSWWKSAAHWAGFSLAHGLALYLHRFALYPLALCAVFLLAAGLDALRRRGRLAAGLLWGLVAMAGCAFLLAPQWAGLRVFFALEGLPGRTVTLRESYLIWHYQPKEASIVWDLIQTYSGGELLGAFFLCAGVAGTLAAGRERLVRSAALWLWLLLPAASLFFVRSHTHFELRYLIFMLPVWLLLAAAGMVDGTAAACGRLASDPVRLRRGALALLTAAVLCLDARGLLAYFSLPKARMREVFAHVAARSRPGDAVIFYPAWDVLWYGYYSLPEGRRLYLPAMFAEGSPAFAPGALLRAHERLWLAATWVADPTRGRELAALRESLGRYYSVAEETEFRSRDPNDDYTVWRLQRRPDALAGLSGGGGKKPAPAPDMRRDPFENRKVRLALNLEEAAAAMAASGQGFFRALDSAALVRDPSGAGRDGAARFCRDGCIALAWSGRGRFGTGRAESDFVPGDVFYLPGGNAGRRVRAPAGTLLLLIAPPGTAPGARGFRGAGGESRRLARLRPPEGGGPPVPEGSSRLWRAGMELSSRRLRSGSAEEDAVSRTGGWQRVVGIVMDGPVHVEDGERSHPMDFRRGDLYLYGRVWPNRWSAADRAASDSLELRFIEDRARVRPENPMTSATGKAGGLWPPMLLP